MRRKSVPSLLASILVCGLVMAVGLVAVSQTDRQGSLSQVTAATADQQDHNEQDDVSGSPPAWAHANHEGRGNSAAKAWKKSTQKITPAQKIKKMAGFVDAHKQGMKKWTDCVAASGNDASKQEACVKPLPPGLAKKLP